jgi:hypothetical protein
VRACMGRTPNACSPPSSRFCAGTRSANGPVSRFAVVDQALQRERFVCEMHFVPYCPTQRGHPFKPLL